jgi:hypothetical protein
VLFVVFNIIKRLNPLAQILLVGDGGQLPVSDNKAVKFYQDVFINGCKANQGSLINGFNGTTRPFSIVELNTGVRQKGDPAYQEALDILRETGMITGVIAQRFADCINGVVTPPENAVHIFYNNRRVIEVNERYTQAMVTTKKTYNGLVIRKGATNDNWLRDFRPIPANLTLAIDMPVKLRNNKYELVSGNKTLLAANGSRGKIKSLGNDHVIVDFGHRLVRIESHEFEGKHFSDGTLSGKFIQLPLHADFATTINSCQGLTIKGPGIISISEDRLGEEQALQRVAALYVMLSRFERIEDVFLDCSDPRVINWLTGCQGFVDHDYFAWLKANRK